MSPSHLLILPHLPLVYKRPVLATKISLTSDGTRWEYQWAWSAMEPTNGNTSTGSMCCSKTTTAAYCLRSYAKVFSPRIQHFTSSRQCDPGPSFLRMKARSNTAFGRLFPFPDTFVDVLSPYSFATVIGMPLKYAQLMPACFTYSDAKILTEKCATPILKQALDLKEGEAEAILEELVCKQNMHGENTFLIEFHIRVLDLILNNSRNESPSLPTRDGNNSWLKHGEDLIMKSYHILNDFPLDWLQEGISEYYKLDLSKKFKLMTFLCDEALNTEKLRSYIHEENSRHAKEVKEAKHKVAATKEKVKCLEKKLRSEKAKVVHSSVSPFPMEEHEALLSKIRIEVDEAHTDMLGLKGITQKEKLGCDALRIKPEFVDDPAEIKIEDEIAKALEEKWYVYGPDKKEEVHKYISERSKKLNRHKVSHELVSEASL
ncbi:hypothetical protein ACSQ67_006140 [Phaseolus vulgaris]